MLNKEKTNHQPLSHLDWLESEAIYILREVAGQLPEEPPEEPELIEEEIIEDDATDRDTDREGFVEEENES